MPDTETKTTADTKPTEPKKKTKKEEHSFEEALSRLTDIVTALEDGSAPLDRSLALYEEGIALVRFCTETLDRAEKQIKVLARTEDGTIAERDFQTE